MNSQSPAQVSRCGWWGFVVVAASLVHADGPDAAGRLDEMLRAVNDVRSLSFRLKDFERIGGEVKAGEERVKVLRKPLRLYFQVLAPEHGVEVLWREGENDGKAWVHPSGFPYVTLSFDPYGSLMRTGHHSLFAAGPWYFSGIVTKLKSKLGERFASHLRDEGEENFDGHRCRKVAIVIPDFGYVRYKVKAREDLDTIAARLGVSEYLILTKNPGLKDYRSVKPEQEILVPNGYGTKTLILIDEDTNLPLSETVYDDVGLFERYEYYDIKVNPAFGENDFSLRNPVYHF